ncbi:hypothetical protein DesyoDRAFT_3099 [Desulfosporosinus youngiae DSM 17734]|uniref:Uncharacterized protein n=1 Tax=Desulfosporosinus youngiae DSM 17734 TaxID=768710 RepID=H5Y531_9FIRM|nr:hypothetical protein DesyoDRAFT_3099 [Desulfosporosinus youngiae DSM 17734]
MKKTLFHLSILIPTYIIFSYIMKGSFLNIDWNMLVFVIIVSSIASFVVSKLK